MTAKHKKLVAMAKRLESDYKRAVLKLDQFKSKFCRAGDKIGETGTRYGDREARVNGRMARPDQVVVQYGSSYEFTGFHPLSAAIREDVEK